MTEHSQTKANSDLPEQALRKRLEERQEEKKSLAEKAHRAGALVHGIMQGINNVFGLISSTLTAYKEVPVIGFALQMVALVPEAISTLAKPEASIPAKIFAGSLLAVITSLSITAFVLGAAPAAIIGLVVASLAGVMQGIELIGKVMKKLKATNTYEHVKAFNNLIKAGCENPNTIPDSNDFNEDFAIRSVELSFFSNKRLAEIEQEQAIKKEQLSAFVDSNLKGMKSLESLAGLEKLRNQHKKQPAPPLFNELIDLETEKLQIISERTFVDQVVDKKNIVIEPDSAADKLKNLYLLRETRLTDLTAEISVLNQSAPEKEASSELLDDILKLQKKIIKIDSKIEEISKPAKKIKLAHLDGNEKLARTFTNFALSGVGIVFSVMALLLIVGVAAPPLILPIMAGFGIGLAAFGVIKWAMEKSADMADEENKIKQDQKKGESILDEAIDCYQHQQSKELSHTGSNSYSKHMRDLLKTIDEPQPQAHTESQDASHSAEVKPEPYAPVLVEKSDIESDVSESQTFKF